MVRKKRRPKKNLKDDRGGLLVRCDENSENIDRDFMFGKVIKKSERPIELSDADVEEKNIEKNSEEEDNGR